MNKNQFRLIFNRARGMLMAVAECAKSHALATGSGNHKLGEASRSVRVSTHTVTIRPLAFSLMLALGMVGLIPNSFSVNTALADIIADQTAPANQRPIVTNAANGVPLVNIQTPSAAGVSRNTYSQFDVSQQGVILNNSRSNVQTQLGGYVQGNPYLATGSARIILNEVNSSNPSLLNGYIEVAGSRAQVVIANPAGISCSGCGFINASVATLTTGTPIMNSGDLTGYRVGGGVINFLGAGLDASQTDYTSVLARAVNINAGIWAQNLNVVTGTNQINVASNGNIASIAPISPNSSLPDGSVNSAPALAIDVAALGGMYAGKIHLIGTEAGVGVRNAGTIGASAGEVRIDTNGNLSNSGNIAASTNTQIQANSITNTGGSISAAQQLNINANSLTGDGKVLAGGAAAVTLSTDYTHTSTGQLQAGGNLTLTTTGDITNQAKLLAGNMLTLNATNIDNTATAEISGLQANINASNTLTNRGLIDGGDTFIAANTINNIGTGAIFGDHIALAANTLNNQNESVLINGIGNTSAAVIAARSRLDIGANNINNLNDSLLFSAGELAIGGNLDANHQASGQAVSLVNQAATIEALGNLTANVADLQNLNSGITTQAVVTGSTAYDQFTPRGTSVILDAADYPAAEIGNQNISWRTAGPYWFREYWRYVYTGTSTQTQLLSSAPAQLLAGGNMTLNGNITNSDSKIIAGSALDMAGASLNNLNSQGQTTTSYNGTAYYYDYDGSGGGFDYDVSASAYNPANNVMTFNLATSQVLQSTAPASVGAASGTTIPNPAVATLNSNSLFAPTANPAASYLIETNPRFASYRTWLSSDYMLTQLSLDPATITKRLGDGFYEQKLIREQVAQLTGQRFLAGYSNEEAQYQALMVNGITFAKAFNITPGIALTELQMAQLTADIVWLVEQTVTLPDGSKTTALVPKVYAKLRDGDLSNTGSLLAGNSVNLNITGDIVNTGTMGSRTLLALNANNIHNLGGVTSGQDVQLNAQQDINNIGGTIAAQNSLILQAGQDINVISTTQSSQNATGASNFSRTNLDRAAGLYVAGGQGLLAVVAGNDINLDAAQIINTASSNNNADATNTNQTMISAGNNINLGTVQVAEQNNSVRNSKNYIKHGSTDDIGTTLQTEGDISLTAGNDLNTRAASITSNTGTLQGVAGNNINISSGEHTDNMATARYVKKSGTFSSKKTTTRDTFNNSNSIGSNLSAEAISLQSGNDLTVQGSNVNAVGDLQLEAERDINIISAQDTHDETHYKKVKQSATVLGAVVGLALIESGADANAARLMTSKQALDNSHLHTNSQVGSTISADNIHISSGGDTLIQSSQVIADHTVDIQAAQDLNITAAQDTSTLDSLSKRKTTGYTGSNAFDQSIGVKKQSQQTHSVNQSSVASTVGSIAGDVHLASGHRYTQTASDVLTPAGDINIAAQQVSIVAGQDSYLHQQTSKFSQTGISASISNPVISTLKTTQHMHQAANKTDNTRMQALAAATTALAANNAAQAVQANPSSAGGIDLNISLGSSKSKSSSTQTNTSAASSHLTAGGDINITATGADKASGQTSDINVIGSQLNANHNVSLQADNQINLLAAQNVDILKNKNSSSSASVGVSFGTSGLLFTAGASGAHGKTKGNGSTWTETVVQGGNQAGDTVKLQSGTDTNLIGAQVIGNQVIANVGTNPTTGETGQGNLNIQSLQDTSQYKDKQQSIGGSISVGAGRMGGSFSYSDSKTKSNYASVNEQSGIMAGDGGFQVNVNGNTNLTGAVIASTDKAANTLDANGQPINHLTTQTLTTSNIQNSAEYSAKGVSVGAGVGLNQQADGTFKNAPTASAGSSSQSDDSSSVTVSGISGGTVSISNPNITSPRPQAGEGQGEGATLADQIAHLNRDVTTQLNTDAQGNITAIAVDSKGNNLASTLTPIFDQAQVQSELNAQVQITQAFSQVAPKAVGDFATNKMNEINLKLKAAEALNDLDQINTLKTELAKWDEGGAYRVGLHTIIGGLTGNVEGAMGAAGSQVAIPIIIDSINKLDAPIELKETLLVGIATSIGALIGDSAGAASAFNTAVNNCNAHECLSMKWDKNAPGYHYYEVETPPLCNVAEAGCMEAVQHELLSNSAPGQDKPAIVSKIVNQKLDYGQNITQYAPSANVVVNGTNDNHIFNDGYVVRTINVDNSGNVTINTKGEGVNESLLNIIPATTMAKINTDKGLSMFKEVGIENLKNIKEKLRK